MTPQLAMPLLCHAAATRAEPRAAADGDQTSLLLGEHAGAFGSGPGSPELWRGGVRAPPWARTSSPTKGHQQLNQGGS